MIPCPAKRENSKFLKLFLKKVLQNERFCGNIYQCMDECGAYPLIRAAFRFLFIIIMEVKINA